MFGWGKTKGEFELEGFIILLAPESREAGRMSDEMKMLFSV